MSKTFWLLSAGIAAIATPAYAQDPAAPADTAAQNDTGEPDIVVTAQGRRQLLQDVPIAVQAVGGEQLQNSGATDIRQLNQLAPSLYVTSTGTEANGSARIRGIGTVGDNPGLESSVAVFIDGVYRSRSGIGLNELGEVERIEVLRGPQGTLFGRNASAGLIHVITRRPEFNFGGYAELSYGNYDAVRAAGAVTGPLSEGVAFRVDGIYSRRDGFYRVVNPTGGTEDRVNDRDRFLLRGQLLFEPNDALSIRLIGDYSRRDESCCGAVYYETREAIDPTPGAANLGDFRYITGQNRILGVLGRLGGTFPSIDDPFNRQIVVSPGRTYQNETTDYGVSGQIEYDFGDVSLTSITAYRGYKAFGAGDFDYSNVDIVYADDDGNAYRRFETFTQELRLNGTAFGGVLDWLVGAYFANEDLTVSSNTRFGTQYGPFAACRIVAGTSATPTPSLFQDPAAPGCLSNAVVPTGAIPGVPAGATFRQAFAGNFGAAGPDFLAALDRLSTLRDLGDTSSVYSQNSRNFAFFTHNIINISEQFSLTLGLRYTNESKDFSADFNNSNTICPVQQAALAPYLTSATLGPAAQLLTILTCTGNSSSGINGLDLQDDFSDGELTGTAVLTYRPSPGNLLYASYSRGFKAGGYNLDRSDLGIALFPRTNADVANLRFAAEVNNAYEVGLKLTRPRWSFNATAFHQRFRDFQLNTFNGLVFIVQNINGCSELVGGPGADSDASAATGTCAPENVGTGVTSTGFELEATLRPTRDITVGLGYTYARTKYEDDLVGSSTGEALDPALFLLAGENLSLSPNHVVTASLAYTPEFGNSGLSGLFYLDTRMSGGFNSGSDLFPEKAQPAYVVVNGRIGIRGPGERWAVEFWAQNLFNENYTQVAFNLPFQSSTSSGNTRAQVQQLGSALSNGLFGAFLAEPRLYGITGRFRF